jgi:hypothetical protein
MGALLGAAGPGTGYRTLTFAARQDGKHPVGTWDCCSWDAHQDGR